MKKNRIIRTVLTAVLISALFTGCGSSSSGSAARKSDYEGAAAEEAYAPMSAAANYDTGYGENYAYDEEAIEEDFAEAGSYENAKDAPTEGEEIGKTAASKRKLITTVNITAESEDMDNFLPRLEQKVQSMGGYMESSNVYQNSYDKHRSAEFTIRIPSARLKEFLSEVENGTNILRRSTNTEDITLQYTDTESHKRALEAEQKQLLEIMSKAEEISDIITIEEQLTDVRYRLDSIRSQLKTYDNQVDYSTVYLNVEEVIQYTEPPVEGPLERIRKGFAESLQSVWDFLVEFFIWFVTHIPQLILFIVFLLILGAIIRVIRAILKKRSEKYRERAAARAEKRAEKQRLKQMKRAGMMQKAGQPQAAQPAAQPSMPEPPAAPAAPAAVDANAVPPAETGKPGSQETASQDESSKDSQK